MYPNKHTLTYVGDTQPAWLLHDDSQAQSETLPVSETLALSMIILHQAEQGWHVI